MTKLILLHEVPNLGSPGDVVDVKPGYARNYLVPRKLAEKWTPGAQKQIDAMAAARRKKEISTVEDAYLVRDKLQECEAIIIEKATATGGRLFGSVSPAEITEAVKEQLHQTIDRRTVMIPMTIKQTGEHRVSVKLHPEVEATFTVRVTGKK